MATMTACGGDAHRAERVVPVQVTTTTVTTRTAPTTTAASLAASTTPPVTKPLTTAPPSPLLDEVVAAYDAAYQDLLAAEATMDPNSPVLDDHMAGAQLEKVREVIRAFGSNGQAVRHVAGGWLRIEVFDRVGATAVDLEICRMDRDVTVGKDGAVLASDARSFRYRESFDYLGGSWKWTGRVWLDSDSQPDCASP